MLGTAEAGDNFGEVKFTAKGRVRLKWQKVILTCLYLFTLGKLTTDRTQCYLVLSLVEKVWRSGDSLLILGLAVYPTALSVNTNYLKRTLDKFR